MICIELQGRLGNQLFQYAFAYATSKKLNCNFYFDRKHQTLFIPKYFKQTKDFLYFLDQTIFSIKGFNDFFTVSLKQKFYATIKIFLKFEEIYISDQIDPNSEILKLKDKKLFTGFFQSESFFLNYKNEIKSKFTIKKKYQLEFKENFENIPKNLNYVVIHVRRGDYSDYNIQLPADYYHKAIALVENEKNFYIIISDDSEFVSSEFSYLKNKHISTSKEIIDLQYLINANICIISNSTFSWWGAYLNIKGAEIFAPKKWFCEAGAIKSPCNILLNSWNLIEV